MEAKSLDRLLPLGGSRTEDGAKLFVDARVQLLFGNAHAEKARFFEEECLAHQTEECTRAVVAFEDSALQFPGGDRLPGDFGEDEILRPRRAPRRMGVERDRGAADHSPENEGEEQTRTEDRATDGEARHALNDSHST